MALINDPNITAQIRDLANTGTIDSNQLVTLLNSVLPAGQQISTGAGVATGIYKRFGDFDKVNAKIEVVTTGLWSGDSGSLAQFFTASAQTTATSGYYYANVYDYNPIAFSDSAEVQYAVAYGHVNGSGSMNLATNDSALLATKATYAQYRSMLLDPTDSKFSFENASGIEVDANAIYVINVARSRFREKMDAGNWSLKLAGGNGTFTFIDNSGKKFGDDLGLSGRVFKVVSGSLNLGTENEATIKNEADTATDLAVGKPVTGEGYGLFYPDRGVVILNAKAIGSVVGDILAPARVYTKDGTMLVSGSISGSHSQASEQFNQIRLIKAIEAGADFEARRTENISTQHFFVRATNREFNYSNNPTYVDADGFFVEGTFETDPQTFITTIGLFNDANELIAVAKTSQPIVKSFDKEVLIKVKLSF
jgi:hypothetical protein